MSDLVTPVVAWGCVLFVLHVFGVLWKAISTALTKSSGGDIGLNVVIIIISIPPAILYLLTLYKLAVHGSELLRAYF